MASANSLPDALGGARAQLQAQSYDSRYSELAAAGKFEQLVNELAAAGLSTTAEGSVTSTSSLSDAFSGIEEQLATQDWPSTYHRQYATGRLAQLRNELAALGLQVRTDEPETQVREGQDHE